jgi:hypothetical protein
MIRSPHYVANWFVCRVNDELVNANRSPVQRAYVAAGQVAWDDCCGMLVGAPERIYRSQVFPGEFVEREICDLGWLNMDLLLEDAGVVWNAIQCAELPDDWEKASLSQTFVGADGGCVGVETRVTVGVPQSKWGVR